MKIKPLGFYVLIEMDEVESVSTGGIVMPADLVSKEQDATATGRVRAIGPTAYVGYPGCEDDPGKWGLELGQRVEYRRFEGKTSAIPEHENFRYIPDSHIIGAVE